MAVQLNWCLYWIHCTWKIIYDTRSEKGTATSAQDPYGRTFSWFMISAPVRLLSQAMHREPGRAEPVNRVTHSITPNKGSCSKGRQSIHRTRWDIRACHPHSAELPDAARAVTECWQVPLDAKWKEGSWLQAGAGLSLQQRSITRLMATAPLDSTKKPSCWEYTDRMTACRELCTSLPFHSQHQLTPQPTLTRANIDQTSALYHLYNPAIQDIKSENGRLRLLWYQTESVNRNETTVSLGWVASAMNNSFGACMLHAPHAPGLA